MKNGNQDFMMFLLLKALSKLKRRLKKMTRSIIFLSCFLILLWQGLTITNTLKTRLEERTNQVQTLINQI